MGKKNKYQFTVRFTPEIPFHKEAAAFLNLHGRNKACIIAEALRLYMQKNGIQTDHVVDDGLPEPESHVEDSTPAPDVPTKENEVKPESGENVTGEEDFLEEYDDGDISQLMKSLGGFGDGLDVDF